MQSMQTHRLQKSATLDDVVTLRKRRASVAFVIFSNVVRLEVVPLVLLRLLLLNDLIFACHILPKPKLFENELIVLKFLFQIDSLLFRAFLSSLARRRLRIHRKLVLLHVKLLITVSVIRARHNAAKTSKVSVFPSDLLSPIVMLVEVNI